MTLALPDVTLCAADCAQPALAARALAASMAACTFADAVLFTDQDVAGPFRTVHIPPIQSRTAYSRFMLKELASRVTTPYVLIIQWDGYVLAPRAWRTEFLTYDYIGAVWPWFPDPHRVGNGGFSLRSLKLLRLTARPDFVITEPFGEDELICRVHRAALEQHFDVRFAPEAVAQQFSYERATPDAPTFGFHGLFNMWRHLSDEEMISLVNYLGAYAARSREYTELLLKYIAMRKFRPAVALFSKMQESLPMAEIVALARRFSADPPRAESLLMHCAQWAQTA